MFSSSRSTKKTAAVLLRSSFRSTLLKNNVNSNNSKLLKNPLELTTTTPPPMTAVVDIFSCQYNTCGARLFQRSESMKLSSRAPGPEVDQVPPKVRQKNLIVAALCLLFVGGVYGYSIRKLKDDELSALEEEVNMINLHESGLKATKVKELLEEVEKTTEKK